MLHKDGPAKQSNRCIHQQSVRRIHTQIPCLLVNKTDFFLSCCAGISSCCGRNLSPPRFWCCVQGDLEGQTCRATCLCKSKVLTPPGLRKLSMDASGFNFRLTSEWSLPERPPRSAQSRANLTGICVTPGRVTLVLEQCPKWCSKTLPSFKAGLVTLST